MIGDKPLTKRQELNLIRSQLMAERQSFEPYWRDLGDYLLPYRTQFSLSEAGRGDRRNQKIIDSTGTYACRTLRSGMTSGITSPARPWFRLTTHDPGLAEFGPVKTWLHTVTEMMRTVFGRGNFYNAAPVGYGDIAGFGTAAISMDEDERDYLRFYPFPIGSYSIANNDRLEVDTFFREFRYTVRQIVMRFGKTDRRTGKADWSGISEYVKEQWDRSNYETQVDVCHYVGPNRDYEAGKRAARFKAFKICYYEAGTGGGNATNYLQETSDQEKFLQESGQDYFPILAPRWQLNGESSYGVDCPGMVALGDIRALQIMQKRKAQAVEKMVNPPMKGPPALKQVAASILPGNITYIAEREGQKGFTPIHEVNPRVQELMLDIEDHQARVRRAFFEDLFLMAAYTDRSDVTAEEVRQRHEEKLLALGPVLEQLNQDFLNPLIDNTFAVMEKRGLIPEAPPELQGQDLKVEYVSIMAQAQKLVGISSLERFAGFVGSLAERTQNPTVLDKVDIDQMVDEYAEAVGVSPRVVRSDEHVAEMREGRAKAQQAQSAVATAREGAAAVKDLSQTDLESNNGLTALLNQAKAGQLTAVA